MSCALTECLETGQYQACLGRLQRLPSRGPVVEGWGDASNSLVCRYKLTMEEAELSKVRNELQQLKTQIQGVPLTEEVLPVYCAVSHNLVHACMTTRPLAAPLVLAEIEQQLRETLGFVCVERMGVSVTGDNLGDMCQVCLRQIQHNTGVLLLVYNCALLQLLQQNYTDATAVLAQLLTVHMHWQAENPATQLLLCFPLDSSHNPRPGPQLPVRQVFCVTYLYSGEHALCHKLITEMEAEGALSDEFLYVKGYTEWKLSRYQECIETCQRLVARSNSQSKLHARCRNLIGCCLANQNSPQCSIQHHQAALNADITDLTPLYNISLRYRGLGSHDAELEALNLICASYKNGENTPDEKRGNGGVMSVLLQRHLVSELSHTAVLYTLARRCMQLERYEVACTKYRDLVELLKSSPIPTHSQTQANTSPSHNTLQGLYCAGIEDVYTELAFCLLSSQQYSECIHICELLIGENSGDDTAHTQRPQSEDEDDLLSMLSDDHVTSQPRQSAHRTRKRSLCAESLYVSQAQLYKSESLLQQGELQQATVCLTRMIESLDSCSEQDSKKRKDTSGNMRMKAESLLHRAHLTLSVALSGLDRLSDALHHSRLTLQHKPADPASNHAHTLLLVRQGRPHEAASHWLGHRGVDVRADGLALARMLEQRTQAAQQHNRSADDMLVNSTVCKEDCDWLDVMCLRIITNQRQPAYNRR